MRSREAPEQSFQNVHEVDRSEGTTSLELLQRHVVEIEVYCPMFDILAKLSCVPSCPILSLCHPVLLCHTFLKNCWT